TVPIPKSQARTADRPAMHVAASLLRESSKCGTRKSAWLLVALSLPMRAAQARSRCSTSIQQVADWLEKLGLQIAKPPCVPVSHPKKQWTDMVRRRRRAARERIGKNQHDHGEAGRQRDAGYHDAPSAVKARSAVDAGQ